MIPRVLSTIAITAGVMTLALSGCARGPAHGISATGVRFAQADVRDGAARFSAMAAAELEARRNLRDTLLTSGDTYGLPEDLRTLAMRSEYMRSTIDGIARRARVMEASYSRAERRAEVTVVANPADVQRDLQAAWQRRGSMLP